MGVLLGHRRSRRASRCPVVDPLLRVHPFLVRVSRRNLRGFADCPSGSEGSPLVHPGSSRTVSGNTLVVGGVAKPPWWAWRWAPNWPAGTCRRRHLGHAIPDYAGPPSGGPAIQPGAHWAQNDRGAPSEIRAVLPKTAYARLYTFLKICQVPRVIPERIWRFLRKMSNDDEWVAGCLTRIAHMLVCPHHFFLIRRSPFLPHDLWDMKENRRDIGGGARQFPPVD